MKVIMLVIEIARLTFGAHGPLSAALYIQSCAPLWIHSIYHLFLLFFHPFLLVLPWLHLIPLISPHPIRSPISISLPEQQCALVCTYTRLLWQRREATEASGWTKDLETLIHRNGEREEERWKIKFYMYIYIFRRGSGVWSRMWWRGGFWEGFIA